MSTATILPIGPTAFKQKREIDSLLKRIDQQAEEIVGLQAHAEDTRAQARDIEQQAEHWVHRAKRDSKRVDELTLQLEAAQARIAELEAARA